MSTRVRSTYHHGDLRSALVNAADNLVRDHGLEGFTLRAAARLAGVSPGAPAHHFGGVKGLLTEVALLGYQRLGDTLAEVPAELDAAEAVRQLCLAYIQFSLQNKGHFRLMFRADMVDRQDPRYFGAANYALRNLAAAFMRYRGKELCETQPFEDSASLLADIAAVHGLAHLILEEKAQSFFQARDREDFLARIAPEFLRLRWP